MLSKPNHNNWHWPIYSVWQRYLNGSLLTSHHQPVAPLYKLGISPLNCPLSTVHTYNTTVD